MRVHSSRVLQGMMVAGYSQLSEARANDATPRSDSATVAVVIATFNHARFLAVAIESVLAQTHPADEIVVVDDGSTDNPGAIVATFPGVRLIRQDNRGPSSARNAGLRSCTSSHVVFLDADDQLLPKALEAGLACIAGRPDCAFVYGGYRLISENRRRIGPDYFKPIDGDAHLAFLRENRIGIPAAALHRVDCLRSVQGFDETLRRAEDLDVYLRLTQNYPIASHPEIVAEYRRHGQNVSNNYPEQLRAGLRLLDRYELRNGADARTRAALREGRANKRKYYISQMLAAASVRWQARHDIGILVRDVMQAARLSPFFTVRAFVGFLARRASRFLPRPIVRWMERIRGRPYPIPVGSIRYGDLRRLTPIDRGFGEGRGKPVDRVYIERFLAKNAADIRGHVLELAENQYTQRFGRNRVERSDVLAVEANPKATIIANLEHEGALPEATFDCIIFTQTLQYLFNIHRAIETLYRALKPGGVLLVTAPAISPMEDIWLWYWTFTAAALCRVLADHFGQDAVNVEAHGNVYVATAFLHGLAVEDLDSSVFNADDSRYPVIVAAHAIKRRDG